MRIDPADEPDSVSASEEATRRRPLRTPDSETPPRGGCPDNWPPNLDMELWCNCAD